MGEVAPQEGEPKRRQFDKADFVQFYTDLYLKYRKITLEELCNLLEDVGAQRTAQRFRKSKRFPAGPDGFLLERKK